LDNFKHFAETIQQYHAQIRHKKFVQHQHTLDLWPLATELTRPKSSWLVFGVGPIL